MALLDKYREFLVDNTRPEFQTTHLTLNAEGWKLLIRENLTPLIEEKLHMRQISDYIWANEYEDGKRKVLSFFFPSSDIAATFKWGWNFDFVPKYSGGKITWAKTDKSIYTHIFEVYPESYQGTKDKITMARHNIDIKGLERRLDERISHHKYVFSRLLPYITEYYDSVDSYAQILNRIERDMENSYYRLINGACSYVTKAFIEKRMGMHEKALQDFEELNFTSEKVRDAYLKKLLALK
ncbi:MAG: hypothetical protein NC321_02960 [Clostridium sp.]|nr:hypothetical protein [Clostridium sp.]